MDRLENVLKLHSKAVFGGAGSGSLPGSDQDLYDLRFFYNLGVLFIYFTTLCISVHWRT